MTFSSAPPSINTKLRKASKAKVAHKDHVAWKKAAGWECKLFNVTPVTGPYGLRVRLNPQRTEIDLDNGLKTLIDMLAWMRMTPDDRQLVRLDVGFDSSIDGACQVTWWPEEKSRKEW